jgi:hypothetical protein
MPEVRPSAAWVRFVETWLDRWLAALIGSSAPAAEVLRIGL